MDTKFLVENISAAIVGTFTIFLCILTYKNISKRENFRYKVFQSLFKIILIADIIITFCFTFQKYFLYREFMPTLLVRLFALGPLMGSLEFSMIFLIVLFSFIVLVFDEFEQELDFFFKVVRNIFFILDCFSICLFLFF